AVRLLLLAERQPQRVADLVCDPEIGDGNIVPTEIDLAREAPRIADPAAGRDPGAAQVRAFDRRRGSGVARMARPIDMQPAADVERVPAAGRFDPEAVAGKGYPHAVPAVRRARQGSRGRAAARHLARLGSRG